LPIIEVLPIHGAITVAALERLDAEAVAHEVPSLRRESGLADGRPVGYQDVDDDAEPLNALLDDRCGVGLRGRGSTMKVRPSPR
jgi:hypothetical protein